VSARPKGLAVAAAFVLASGCGFGHSEPMHPLGTTLLIVNESTFAYRVTVSPTLVIVVGAGQSQCVWAGRESEARRIEFASLADPTTYYTPWENLMNASGWILEIGATPRSDVHTLRPAQRCKEPIIEPDSAAIVEPPGAP
jgi:hypothetical protein